MSIDIWHNLCLSYNCHDHFLMTTSWEEETRETRFEQVESTITTSTNVCIPSIVSTIAACWHNDQKNEVERTWVFAQDMEPNIPSNGGESIFELHHVWQCIILHEHNEKCVSDYWIYGLATHALINTTSHKMGEA